MAPVLKRVTVTFGDEGTIEYAIHYTHNDTLPTPGSKKRTTTATRMAQEALETGLEGLDKGALLWGGFATDTRKSEDRIISEGRASH
jgi:hypothetical protein